MLENNPFENDGKNFKPLLLDGAIGSYLQQRGFESDDVLWTTKINQSNPEAVIKTHKEYIEAGADIVTTNTFRTNPIALENSNIAELNLYVSEAVKLAKEAVAERKMLIAGSNAPAEDCYKKERTLSNKKLLMNHCKHIDSLVDNGVDFVLNETQSHLDELLVISEHCDKNRIPYVVSLYFDENLKILSGENLDSVLSFLKNTSALAIGLNCISPELFSHFMGSMEISTNWGFYINCGDGHPNDKVINCKIQPEEYLGYVKQSLVYHPSFIGSCCGSNPSHTKKIREYLDGQNYC